MNPWIVRNILFPIKERLTGGHTGQYLAELERMQWLSPEELRELQWAKLQALLKHAYENVPYYRRVFEWAGLTPEDIRTPEDFLSLPFLTKREVRDNFSEMISRTAGTLISTKTGGTTGAPQKFLYERSAKDFRNALELRSRRWWGTRYGDRQLYLWGRSRDLIASPTGEFKHRIGEVCSYLINRRQVSAYDLSPLELAQCMQVLRAFRPKFLYGYTSSIYQLARYIETSGIDGAGFVLEVAICTTSPLYEEYRRTIEGALHCRVANEYGCAEGGIFAHECPRGRLHLLLDSVYMEFLHNNRPVAPGELGEIVVTPLNQRAFPLIRYRTGDAGCYSDEICECGRGLPLLQTIDGRALDFIVGPGKRLFSGQLFQHIFDPIKGIVKFKIIQEATERLRILVVRDSNFSHRDLEFAKRKVHHYMGDDVEVRIEFVEDIPLENSGKFRVVVSDVSYEWN